MITAKMTDDLRGALMALKGDEPVTVVLQLASRPLPKLSGSRRDRLLALRESAEKERHRLVKALRGLQHQFPRLEFRDGGLFNHVIIRAPKTVILRIPDLPDVEAVLPDREFEGLRKHQ